MPESIDSFVNNNKPNAFAPTYDLFTRIVDFEQVYHGAAPVHVFLKNGELVAWFDDENECGFVKE